MKTKFATRTVLLDDESLDDAIRMIEANDRVADHNAAILQARDLVFLKMAAEHLNKDEGR